MTIDFIQLLKSSQKAGDERWTRSEIRLAKNTRNNALSIAPSYTVKTSNYTSWVNTHAIIVTALLTEKNDSVLCCHSASIRRRVVCMELGGIHSLLKLNIVCKVHEIMKLVRMVLLYLLETVNDLREYIYSVTTVMFNGENFFPRERIFQDD